MDKTDNMLELNNGTIVPAKSDWFRSDVKIFSYYDDSLPELIIFYDKIFKKYKFIYPRNMIIHIPFKSFKIKKYITKKIICKIKRKQL